MCIYMLLNRAVYFLHVLTVYKEPTVEQDDCPQYSLKGDGKRWRKFIFDNPVPS